jgi:hypothetical protein
MYGLIFENFSGYIKVSVYTKDVETSHKLSTMPVYSKFFRSGIWLQEGGKHHALVIHLYNFSLDEDIALHTL